MPVQIMLLCVPKSPVPQCRGIIAHLTRKDPKKSRVHVDASVCMSLFLEMCRISAEDLNC